MKDLLISFAVGLVVGTLYALIRVRSPAPPFVALAGLLGMVVGEQLLPLLRDSLQAGRTEAHAAPARSEPRPEQLLKGR